MGKFIITSILLAASLLLNISISRSAKKSSPTDNAKPQRRINQTFDIELKELQKNIGSKPVKKIVPIQTPAVQARATAD